MTAIVRAAYGVRSLAACHLVKISRLIYILFYPTSKNQNLNIHLINILSILNWDFKINQSLIIIKRLIRKNPTNYFSIKKPEEQLIKKSSYIDYTDEHKKPDKNK